jgi:hypothetical protein
MWRILNTAPERGAARIGTSVGSEAGISAGISALTAITKIITMVKVAHFPAMIEESVHS